MKLVINGCYGGFGLSNAAKKAYVEKKGKSAFFYREDRDSAQRPGDRDYDRIEGVPEDEVFGASLFSVDMGERVDVATLWDHGDPFSDYDIERDDPDLVAVVEEMGDKASSWASKLHVVEIPDGTDYVIEEYDGIEHVAEAHRTWA